MGFIGSTCTALPRPCRATVLRHRHRQRVEPLAARDVVEHQNHVAGALPPAVAGAGASAGAEYRRCDALFVAAHDKTESKV